MYMHKTTLADDVFRYIFRSRERVRDRVNFSVSNSNIAQWLIGRVLDSRPRGRRFEHHRRHCAVSSSKNINPSLVLVQPRKTRPFIAERLFMGRKEANQTNKHHQIKAIQKRYISNIEQNFVYNNKYWAF